MQNVHGRLQTFERCIAYNGLILWEFKIKILENTDRDACDDLRTMLENSALAFEQQNNINIEKCNMEFYIVFTTNSGATIVPGE